MRVDTTHPTVSRRPFAAAPALFATILLSACDRRPDPARIAQARAAEARAASQRAAAATQADEENKVLDDKRHGLSGKLAAIRASVARPQAIPSCAPKHSTSDVGRRAIAIEAEHLDIAAVQANVPVLFAAKTLLGTLTSEELYLALSSSNAREANTAIGFVDATQYLVVVRPTKHRSPRETTPGTFEPGELAATGYLFDLQKATAVCQTTAQATDIGTLGITGIRRGGDSLPVNVQLDRQLGRSLLAAFDPKFHRAVADFGRIHQEDLKL